VRQPSIRWGRYWIFFSLRLMMRTRPFTSAAAKLAMARLSSDQMPSTGFRSGLYPGSRYTRSQARFSSAKSASCGARWMLRLSQAGHKVRYFTAAELAETLYRGLADNSVGRVIDTLLRNDLILIDEVGFAPMDDTGAQLLFRVVAAAYERRALGIASHWPFESWGRFLPEHTTAVSLLDRLLHHANVVVTASDSYRMREARAKGGTTLNKT
jgi:hypothetical protein